jgi:hypothetical protein
MNPPPLTTIARWLLAGALGLGVSSVSLSWPLRKLRAAHGLTARAALRTRSGFSRLSQAGSPQAAGRCHPRRCKSISTLTWASRRRSGSS